MEKNVKLRKGLSTLQIDKEAFEILKQMGTKDESYSKIIKRTKSNPYNLDEGIIKQLNEMSEKWGLDSKTMITFGIVFVIFLASSGTFQHIQNMAMKSNKPMLTVFIELLKRFKI
jgi:type II secretory pathway component PulL